nr:BfmA/BtgA family mobilization protein [uncultured Carboxylicivirga sp.]
MSTTITTTNIGKAELRSLRTLAKKHDLKQVDFINHCISYFRKTGINPADEIFSPREEINKLNQRMDQVIRFIRTQEEKKLNPLFDELIAISKKLNNQMEDQITSKHFNAMINYQKVLSECVQSIQELSSSQMKNIYSILDMIPEKINGSNQILSLIKQLLECLYYSQANKTTMGRFREEDIFEFKEIVGRFNQLQED